MISGPWEDKTGLFCFPRRLEEATVIWPSVEGPFPDEQESEEQTRYKQEFPQKEAREAEKGPEMLERGRAFLPGQHHEMP